MTVEYKDLLEGVNSKSNEGRPGCGKCKTTLTRRIRKHWKMLLNFNILKMLRSEG